MKKVIVIGAYPSNPEREEVLLECISRLSNIGYDLIVVSHYPIPDYIQKKVNYCIYDKENIFLPTNLTPSYWFGTEACHVEIFNEGHFLTCSKNMLTSLNLANALKYDFFYYMESDNFLEPEDITKMEFLKELMFLQNKNMILFKSEDGGNPTYDTLLFGGRPDYFVKNATLPTNLEEYIALNLNTTIERTLYGYLNADENNLLTIEGRSKQYFNKSQINTISHEGIVEVIGNEETNQLFLWISNDYANTQDIQIKVYPSDNYTILKPGNWAYIPKEVGDHIIVEMKEESGFTHKKEFTITEENREQYFKKGKISFR